MQRHYLNEIHPLDLALALALTRPLVFALALAPAPAPAPALALPLTRYYLNEIHLLGGLCAGFNALTLQTIWTMYPFPLKP